MRSYKWLTLLFCAAALNGFALLPPLYESIAEFKGVLTDPQFAQVFQSGEPIESIVRTEGGLRITSSRHVVDVVVSRAPQQMPGPARYEYEFGTVQDR